MKTTSRSLIATISIFFILISLWVFFKYDFSEIKKIVQLSRKRTLLRKEFQEEKNNLLKVKEILKSYDSFLSEKEIISLALPSFPKEAEILNQIETLAELSKVKISRVNFSEKVSSKKESLPVSREKLLLIKELAPIEINFSLEGDYSQIKEFLKNLSQNIRIFEIKEIRLTKGEEAIEAEIRFTAYWQP